MQGGAEKEGFGIAECPRVVSVSPSPGPTYIVTIASMLRITGIGL